MGAILRKSLKTIEDYKSSNPHYTELLDILGEILILREQYRNNMTSSIFAVDENIISQKMEGGLPLIDFTGNKYDLVRPKRVFLFFDFYSGKRMPEESKNILKIINDKQFDWEKMVRASFDPTEEEPIVENLKPGSEAEDQLDLIDLFLEESLRPELESVAEKYGQVVDKSHWTEGYCPICGKEPKIGEIRNGEEGERYLFVISVDLNGISGGLNAPFCGNEEQHSLAYFAVEGEERYRVDVCNKCRRYIKMVDLPDTKEEVDLDVEDIATLHLDMIAFDEGYN